VVEMERALLIDSGLMMDVRDEAEITPPDPFTTYKTGDTRSAYLWPDLSLISDFGRILVKY